MSFVILIFPSAYKPKTLHVVIALGLSHRDRRPGAIRVMIGKQVNARRRLLA